MLTRGEGVKKSENFVDVFNGCPFGLWIRVEDASTQVCQTKEVVFHTMRGRSRG